MFEHKNLDSKWNRVIPASDTFIHGEVLECRDNASADPEASGRLQYGVIGDRLVERALPPESVGDHWSYDADNPPWWSTVNNPPHAGLVADFNSHNGGLHRKPLDAAHNVVAFASAGEEVTFANCVYTVVRQNDNKEITAASMLALRKSYFAQD